MTRKHVSRKISTKRQVNKKLRASTRKPGRLRGKIRVGRNFDEPLPARLFE